MDKKIVTKGICNACNQLVSRSGAKSRKDYLIGLLAKDTVENPIKYLDNKSFEKELKNIFQNDSELMQKLFDC